MNTNPTSININMLNQEKPEYSLTVPVTWNPKKKWSILNWLLRKPTPSVASDKTFTFNLCVLANMPRIAKTAAELPKELFGNSAEEMLLGQVEKFSEDLIYIVAAGIQNNRDEPDEELIEFIRNNFDNQLLHKGFMLAIRQLGLEYFIQSLAIIRPVASILKPKGDA